MHHEHFTEQFFTRLYSTCYYRFGNCYTGQAEAEASCVCVCVCVCACAHVSVCRGGGGFYWASLGSEERETVLESAGTLGRRACDWLGVKLERPCSVRSLQSLEQGASSAYRQMNSAPSTPFLEGIWCSNGQVCWVSKSHITQQSCIPFLTHFCGKDAHSLVLKLLSA